MGKVPDVEMTWKSNPSLSRNHDYLQVVRLTLNLLSRTQEYLQNHTSQHAPRCITGKAKGLHVLEDTLAGGAVSRSSMTSVHFGLQTKRV